MDLSLRREGSHWKNMSMKVRDPTFAKKFITSSVIERGYGGRRRKPQRTLRSRKVRDEIKVINKRSVNPDITS